MLAVLPMLLMLFALTGDAVMSDDSTVANTVGDIKKSNKQFVYDALLIKRLAEN